MSIGSCVSFPEERKRRFVPGPRFRAQHSRAPGAGQEAGAPRGRGVLSIEMSRTVRYTFDQCRHDGGVRAFGSNKNLFFGDAGLREDPAHRQEAGSCHTSRFARFFSAALSFFPWSEVSCSSFPAPLPEAAAPL